MYPRELVESDFGERGKPLGSEPFAGAPGRRRHGPAGVDDLCPSDSNTTRSEQGTRYEIRDTRYKIQRFPEHFDPAELGSPRRRAGSEASRAPEAVRARHDGCIPYRRRRRRRRRHHHRYRRTRELVVPATRLTLPICRPAIGAEAESSRRCPGVEAGPIAPAAGRSAPDQHSTLDSRSNSPAARGPALIVPSRAAIMTDGPSSLKRRLDFFAFAFSFFPRRVL